MSEILNESMAKLVAYGADMEALAEIVPGAAIIEHCLTATPDEVGFGSYTEAVQIASASDQDLEDATAALLAHGADLEALAETIPGAEVIEGALVLEPDEFWACDGEGPEEAYPGYTRAEAARDYAEDGDYAEPGKTAWVKVCTYLRGLDEDGLAEEVKSRSHTITLEPAEPGCVDGKDHDWQAPYELLGGIESNPGCQAHGGGVRYTCVCAHCGAYCDVDTWAQNPSTGEQGLRETTYRDADEASLEWAEKQTARAE